MRLIPLEAAPQSMTVETSGGGFGACGHGHALAGPNRPNGAMPSSPGHDEAGRAHEGQINPELEGVSNAATSNSTA